MTRREKLAIAALLSAYAVLIFGTLAATAGSYGPGCCTQAKAVGNAAAGALEELELDHPARGRLEKALEYAFGPCSRDGRRLVCDGLR